MDVVPDEARGTALDVEGNEDFAEDWKDRVLAGFLRHVVMRYWRKVSVFVADDRQE
jgi:hypothetical protein